MPRMRVATTFLCLTACVAPSPAPKRGLAVVIPVVSVAPAPGFDLDAAMSDGWKLLATDRTAGLEHLRTVVSAASASAIPGHALCGKDDAPPEASDDGHLLWIRTPKGVFFFAPTV